MTYYGGQALIEGVMMRGKHVQANAVRLENGDIACQTEKINTLSDKYPILGLPFIRGSVQLFESLYVGMKAMSWATEQSINSDKESQAVSKVTLAATILLSIALGILLFFMLPVALSHLTKDFIVGTVAQNAFEGILRVIIFLLYLFLISQMNDIKRVFGYHGAEHKTIHCYEHGLSLTPENARQFPRLHARCGTSFLFLVMIISIFVFAFVGVDNLLIRFVSRIVLLPVVAGLSYELLKVMGKYSNKCKVIYFLSLPGLKLQQLTTLEPDENMLEVAICALEAVLAEEKLQTH